MIKSVPADAVPVAKRVHLFLLGIFFLAGCATAVKHSGPDALSVKDQGAQKTGVKNDQKKDIAFSPRKEKANDDLKTSRPLLARVSPHLGPLDLSRAPSNEELMAAGQLGGQLYPTHELADKEREKVINLSFGKAIQQWNRHEYKQAVQAMKQHVADYPDSPWASEAILHVGCDCQYSGKYSEADANFDTIIASNKGKATEGATLLTNKAKLRKGALKVYQNNFDGAKTTFTNLMATSNDWRERTYASHWLQRLATYTANELAMLNCGTLALAYLLEKDGRETEARAVKEMLPETLQGHSLKALSDIAAKYGYNLAALRVETEDIPNLPLNSIMHIGGKNPGDSGHYWVLEKRQGDGLVLFDPQANRSFTQSIQEFSKEWSGNALVFAGAEALPGRKLSEGEVEQIYGGCCGVPRAESNLGDPDLNKGPRNPDDDTSCGAPTWSINMVNMNLFVTDTPLWYGSPIGPPVGITLNYNSQSATSYHSPFGNKWQYNYGSYLVVDTGWNVTIFMPDGRRNEFTPLAIFIAEPWMGPGWQSDVSHGYRPSIYGDSLRRIHVDDYGNNPVLYDDSCIGFWWENRYELTLADGSIYVYDIPANTNSLQPFLIEIRDPHGQKIAFNYNTDIRMTSITDAMNRVTTLTYNADGLATQVTDPFGRSASFEYDTNKNLTKITDMGGYWSKFSYDLSIYLTSIENDRGAWGFYIEPTNGIFNGADRYPAPGGRMWYNYRITVTNPLGGKEEYFYGAYSRFRYGWYIGPKDYKEYVNTEINNNQSSVPKTYYDYVLALNMFGVISRISYPEGGFVEYGYDGGIRRTSAKDSHGHTTYFTYNYLGSMTSLTNPKGANTSITYANNVDLIQVQDGLGTVTLTYNNKHDVLSVTDRLGNVTSYTYNDFGQVTSKTDALGVATSYTYDADNQLQQIAKDGKTLALYAYDPIGRVRTYTGPTGLALTYDYNNLNNITKITYPDAKFESYAYSSCCPHLMDSITDRSSRTTSYTYNALKRLTQITNPENGLVKYFYDVNSKPVKFIDTNGNATTYEYDKDYRLNKIIYPDGKYMAFGLDGDGLIATVTNGRGIRVAYTYDQNDNLVAKSYSDNTPGVTYTYDDYDRITKRQDETGAWLFGYDVNSRLISVDGPWANDTRTYQYDALGRRTGFTPQGGQAVTYSYDALSRMTGMQAGSNNFGYVFSNANPLVQSLIRPGTGATNYTFDSLNRLTGLANVNSSDQIINTYTYAYNQKDLVSSVTTSNGTPITTFQNRLQTSDYNSRNQQLSSTGPDRTFTYDDDGNMTRGYTPEGYVFTAAYDAGNRLRTLTYADAGGIVHKTEYYYSGNGFLAQMKKYDNAALVSDTRYVRDGSLTVQERDGNNSVTRENTWGLNMGGGIGGLLNLQQGGLDYSYLYDGKGNVTTVLDGSESVAAAYAYDAFGVLMSKTGTLNQSAQFSTKPYDEKTGLVNYGYRFYSPAMGRWITRDPIGESGGFNLYGFVGNNPVNWRDPYGLVTAGEVGDALSASFARDYNKWKCRLFGFIIRKFNEDDNVAVYKDAVKVKKDLEEYNPARNTRRMEDRWRRAARGEWNDQETVDFHDGQMKAVEHAGDLAGSAYKAGMGKMADTVGGSAWDLGVGAYNSGLSH